MLILTRHIGEKLIIDNDIKVIILGIKKGQIRIGIEAPKTIEVFREEIFLKIQAAIAAQNAPDCSLEAQNDNCCSGE